MIKPNLHRITVFSLSNIFLMDMYYFLAQKICQLIRLETFILNRIETKHIENVLKFAITLEKLSSLTIHLLDYVDNSNNILKLIFSSPHLKTCQIQGDRMRILNQVQLNILQRKVILILINSMVSYHIFSNFDIYQLVV